MVPPHVLNGVATEGRKIRPNHGPLTTDRPTR